MENKSHNAEKLKGGTFWSRPVCNVTRKKQEKPFWFSLLGQMVQFVAILLVELLRIILVSSCG